MRQLVLALLVIGAVSRAEGTLQSGDVVVMSAYVGSIGGMYFDEVSAFRKGILLQRIETFTGGLDSGLLCDRESVFIGAGGVIQRFNPEFERSLFAAVDMYPKSFVRDVAGNMYVSGVSVNDGVLIKVNPSGAPASEYTPWRNARWVTREVDLAADQCTLLGRVSGAATINRIDVCAGASLSDIVLSLPPTAQSGAIRLLPDRTMLIANGDAVYRVSETGTVRKRYWVDGSVNWTTLAIDPGALTFRAGAVETYWGTGIVYQFDIGSGDTVSEPIRFLGIGVSALGVIGEYRAASVASQIPLLGSMTLLLLAIALGVAAVVRL